MTKSQWMAYSTLRELSDGFAESSSLTSEAAEILDNGPLHKVAAAQQRVACQLSHAAEGFRNLVESN